MFGVANQLLGMLALCVGTTVLMGMAAISSILRTRDWFEHLRAETPETVAARVAQNIASCCADDSYSLYAAGAIGSFR